MSKPKRWRASVFIMTLAMGGLLAGACTASRHTDESVLAPQTTSDPVSTATAQNRRTQTPVWPVNAVAQRKFTGEQMFVEHIEGQRTAWVISAPAAGQAEALNFFTGERMPVVIGQVPGPQKAFMFTDAKGRTHRWIAGSSFLADDSNGNNGGAVYFGDDNNFLDFRDSLYADGMQGLCPLELTVVAHRPDAGDASTQDETAWTRIPMYLEPPSADCPNGRWASDIRSALDLGDGTLLLTLGEYVFRLRMSDFSPVGEAPMLRITDAQQVKPAVDRIKAQKIRDPNAYLSSILASSDTQTSAWPANAVTQRAFAGEQMFVEEKDGRKIVWVLSAAQTDKGEALDFFSGDVVPVTPKYTRDGHPEPEFIGRGGKRHQPIANAAFRFKDPRPGGAMPIGDPDDAGYIVFSSETLRFTSIRQRGCLPDFVVISRIRGAGATPETLWKKVPLYREAPSAACPEGRWNSLIHTAMDLGDGTMLVTTTAALTVRLRQDDLSPAGDTPDLEIVAAETVKALIAEVAAQPADTRERFAQDALRKITRQEVAP